MVVIGMTGEAGRRLAMLCDLVLTTPSRVTPRIQEGHIVLGHALCELVERAMFGSGVRAPRSPRRARRAIGRGRRAGRS
jgi:D-sedoheptulose 7-phosphate isomerase